jgi:hypothetical protein
MVLIPFTRKRNIKGLTEPILFSKRIQLSSEVKFLGIILDKGLTWKKQLDKVIDRAYKAFWTCRVTFGKTWRLKSKVVYWIHTAVVRPIVTNAATIWWPRVKLKTSQAELSRLQRTACLGIILFYFFFIILTAIGLMPGCSVTKIGRAYKKFTYIARKQNIQLTKKQHISQNFTVQYKCNEQNTRYKTQENKSIHRNNKTQSQGKSYCRELNPGRQACSSTLPYELP